MLLSEILEGIEYSGTFKDREITGIYSDTDKIKEGGLFVCLIGENTDSHSLISLAFRKGAAAVVSQRKIKTESVIIVKDTAEALAVICSAFYFHPEKKLKLIGVTGTNGKTSVTHMIKSILESVGRKTGLIGTVRVLAGEEVIITSQGLTTPEPPEMYRLFSEMAESGCEYCVMEVSSQALAQKRCFGLEFETAVFTNFTQDHLDYHKTMDNYAAAKRQLFLQSKKCLFNKDDPMCGYMSNGIAHSLFYSLKDKSAGYYGDNVKFDQHGSGFTVHHGGRSVFVSEPIPGIFSVYNALAAFACAELEGNKGEKIAEALKKMKPVPGRCEVLSADAPFSVIIDYAHSPDALENILSCVRSFTKGRVVALFGCGGDRDKTKRPLMAAAAADNSDYVIITSDNPRTENPNRIIEDIIPGINNKNIPCAVIPDRTHAIEFAVRNAKAGDSIVLCGKGHETYQIIGKTKYDYDEREIALRAIKTYSGV